MERGELEEQYNNVKRNKDTLVHKHMTFKIRCEKTIEKLSNMLSSANYRVSQQQKEIKFVHDKIKEFMRKHQQHLPSQVFLELDVIVHSSDYNSKDNAMYQPPKNEYDANV